MKRIIVLFAVAAMALAACTEQTHSVKILAHRGNASTGSEFTTDENTLDALRRAQELNFDGVEFDTEKEGAPYWIRLEITLKSDPSRESYKIPIYQNEESYSNFEIHKLSGKEKPE